MIQGTKFAEWPIAMPYVLVHPETHDQALAANPAKFQVPKVEYRYGVATQVDASAKTVTLKDGAVVPYDALVVATGFNMPLIYPAPGTSLQERRAEVRRVGEALRKASAVVVSGGGVVGLEVAGDQRVAFPEQKVVLLC